LTIRNGLNGIGNNGTLTINNSTVSGNSAPEYGGGGIGNNGTLTINNSTVSGNSAGHGSQSVAVNYQALSLPSGFGGGILNNGTLTINNSTVSGNSAIGSPGGAGGGIWSNNRTLTINNSTISGNSASGTIGGIDNSSGTATLQNSIVANNLGGNCGGTMTSNGYNLSSDGTCSFKSTGDLNNTDPKLGPLQDNGGPTHTMDLLSGSPAIDAGNPGGCTDGQGHLLTTDQRGMPRPDREDKSGCDMGAYEEQGQLTCIPLGDPCFGPGPLKCCPAFPRHTFCSSKTGWGYCLIDSLDPTKPL